MFKIIKYVQNKIKGAKMSRRKKKNKAKKIIKSTLIIAVTFIIIVFFYFICQTGYSQSSVKLMTEKMISQQQENSGVGKTDWKE